ncbi:MAG: RNA methyltransferase [Candidatus Tyloplasma litorale]|nr:MAG: RNA methyltransferase [Mycoplasmatales bacterium]
MKINFGNYKRKKLIVGDNNKMKPTQAMAKSIIFNKLNINENDKVVDLFAGTGALGFEAVSLGAKIVYWSDVNKHSYNAIQKNIELLKLDSSKFKVFKSDFRMVLKKLPFKPTIIFLDPPFIATKYYNEALQIILDNDLLDEDGLIVMEKPFKLKIELLNENNFSQIEVRKFGDKDIVFAKK